MIRQKQGRRIKVYINSLKERVRISDFLNVSYKAEAGT